ncbi:MAG TPA: hypothetical protein VK922_14495 [Gemmatimonadaceae bacterium]|nr:hypothetical protein [Gemmatimonadaceae bacterium]
MTRLLTKIVAGVGVAALVGACVRGDPVSPAGNVEGNAWLFTGASTNPSPLLPMGTADVRISLDVDPTVIDAFSRAPTVATVTNCGSVNFPVYGRSWSCLNEAWRWTSDLIRGSTAPRIDTRYPHPVETGVGFSGNIINFFQPTGLGGDYWNLFGGLTGLKPNTTYQVVFVHYRLRVAGALDQTQRILQGVVGTPDTLVLVAGTPASTNTDWTGAAPVGCAPFPGVTTNAYSVATVTTSGTGDVSFDKCWQSGNGIWTMAEFGTQSKSMVGTNNNTTYSLPNYNYLEVWETAYGVGSGPAMRVQIAQDLAPNGTPIPNAYAPFPAPGTTLATADQQGPAAVDRGAAFPISYTTALALPSTFGAPDSVTISLTNVEALATGTYKVWFVNPTTNAASPATGKWVRVVGTDTVASSTGTSTFEGGPGTIHFTTDSYFDIGQPDVSDSLSVLLVSIEQNAGAAAPSTAQPFWTTVIKKVGGTVGGAMLFGEFTLGDNSRGPERFIAQGTMSGGVIGDTVVVFVDTTINGEATRIRGAEFVGSRVEVKFTGLMRPPLGYRYAAYLCGSASGTCTEANTSFFELGGLMSPSGLSLDNADSAPNDGNLSDTRIVTAIASAVVSGGQTLCDFDRFRLVLEPIDGAGPPLAHVFDTALPAQLTGARSCR